MRACVGSMEAAKQLVQRAEHLRGELGRDLGLCVAAGFEQSGEAAVRRVIVQPERGKDQLETAEHRAAANVAERAKRKLQPAAGLPARRIDEAQFAVGQQKSGRHAGLAQQPLELLMRRCLPAFERAALIGVHAGALEPNQDLPALVGFGHRPMWRQISSGSPRRGWTSPPAAPAHPERPRLVLRASRGPA